ncbi:MAG: hypothetical protein LBK47_06775 [Prevotellaceae bacterium]|nr:hypothetical protein [Prevotellaceae bacterium]
MKNVTKNGETLCQKLGTDFNNANLLFGAGRLNGIQMSQVWGSGGPTSADAPTDTNTPTPCDCDTSNGKYDNHTDVPMPTPACGEIEEVKYKKHTENGDTWYIAKVSYSNPECTGSYSEVEYYQVIQGSDGCWRFGGRANANMY